VINGCERDQTDVSGLTTAPAIFEDHEIGEPAVLESGDLDRHEMPTEAASDRSNDAELSKPSVSAWVPTSCVKK